MSETANVTKQFLDKDGLNALWTKICDNFASKDDLNDLTSSDTKNTTGATNTNSKIYLVGATSQSANPVTYSHDTAYVGSDGYLYSNSKKVNMDIVPTLIQQGNEIPENADLNTTEYLRVGIYTCKLQSTVATLKNCPVSNGFRMEVYSYQSSNTDDGVLTTAQYVYRLRKIIRLSGEQYYQFVNSTTQPGVFTYSDWQYIPTTKATIDTTDTNGSSVTNGDASTPVYINSAGKFAACTGVYSDSKSCIPNSSLNYDLGSSTRLFSTTYTRYIDTASGYNLRLKAADTEHMNMYGGNVNTTAHIIPTVNNTYNLGSGDYKWKNIYASNFIENGANINTIYADKSYADYCSSYLHSANRAQFCKPAGVTIEYSTDGGSTWIDYGATDDQKVGFFSGISQNFTLGKSISTKATSSDMLRITMDATAMGVYISCKCLLLNVSTNGSSNFNVKVEKSMKGSADTFGTFIESQTLTGWSGWNRIPIGYNFGGGNTQNYNIAKLRLTFSSDGAGSSYTSGAHAYVLDMEVLGNTYWTIPHTMAKTGHLYTWDVKGNAIFNESVTAKYIYPNNGIVFAGTDSDRNLIRIGGNVNETIDSKANYGYTLKFLGSGQGVNNALALYADNEKADEQILGTKWLNDGTMYSRNVLPHDNNTYSLGSSFLKWKNIYATTFTGHLTGTVSMTGGADNAYRNILVTNGSNGICYSSAGNVQLNYATGDVRATSFTGNLIGNVTGNVTGTADIAKTLPHFKISSNSALPSDGSPKYVKFATITIPTTAWSRKSITLFFQDYEANGYQGDILTIQASSNKDGVGVTPNIKWVTKYQNLTIDSIIISKISDNVYDLYLEAKMSYITLRVFYLTLDDVGPDKTFNFINNASSWSTTAPEPITSRSTLKNVASELGSAKTLWGQSFNGTANVSGDMTSVGSITMSKALTINGTNQDTANLHFGRTSYNYISSPSGSTIHMCPGGITKDSTHGYVFGASEFYPGTTNMYNLGSSSLKWKNIYAMTFTGALNGNVTGDVNGNVTGNLTGDVNGNVTGNLTGDVNGNLTGNVTGNVTGSSGSCTGNAASATNASNIYINTTTRSSYYPMTFVTTTSAGNTKLYIGGSTGTTSSGSGIRYNPSSKVCYCSGGFYEASDERLKNFGDDIEVDLDKLSKLSKKYFTWKDDEYNTQHIGVSAQEVQDIYPELVEVIDEEGHLSVSYDKLSVVALKGIDILNDKVKSLEERLERLEKIING